MDDWRIIKEHEQYWKSKKLFKIIFPEFWQSAYETKNIFFQYVFAEAKKHVELLGKYKEYLEGDCCREFWHRHCNFCMKEITTDMNEECYCSEDGSDWICSECFNDFKERFGWKVFENIQDIPAEKFKPLEIMMAKGKSE